MFYNNFVKEKIIKLLQEESSKEHPLNYTEIGKKLGGYDYRTVKRPISELVTDETSNVKKTVGGFYYNINKKEIAAELWNITNNPFYSSDEKNLKLDELLKKFEKQEKLCDYIKEAKRTIPRDKTNTTYILSQLVNCLDKNEIQININNSDSQRRVLPLMIYSNLVLEYAVLNNNRTKTIRKININDIKTLKVYPPNEDIKLYERYPVERYDDDFNSFGFVTSNSMRMVRYHSLDDIFSSNLVLSYENGHPILNFTTKSKHISIEDFRKFISEQDYLLDDELLEYLLDDENSELKDEVIYLCTEILALPDVSLKEINMCLNALKILLDSNGIYNLIYESVKFDYSKLEI